MKERMSMAEAIAVTLGCSLEEAEGIDTCDLFDEDNDMIDELMFGDEPLTEYQEIVLKHLRNHQ